MNPNLSKEVFEYHNKLRQNPQLLIPVLEKRLTYFKGNVLHMPGAVALTTKEGDVSVKECIEFLKKQKPLPPLAYEKGLEEAARDHAEDIGKPFLRKILGSKGMTGHEGSDHSTTKQRIERHGNWKPGSIGENISFGKNTGEDVVLQLVVDDGVPNRGHRTNFFDPDYKLVGIFACEHKSFKYVVVLDYSVHWKDGAVVKNEAEQKKKKEKKQKEEAEGVKKEKVKEDLPEGAKSLTKKIKTIIKGGKKHIITTKVYKMKDGSVQEKVEEDIQDA